MEMNWKQAGMVYPGGTYKVRIESIEKLQASTGTWQYRWKARIVKPSEYEGNQIVDHTAITEKALWRIAWLVSACGINTSTLPKMDVNAPFFSRVINACVGRTVYWHVIARLNNQGKERNEIDNYKKDDEQEPLDFVQKEELPDCLK